MTINQLFDHVFMALKRKHLLVLLACLLMSLNSSAQESKTVTGVVTSVTDGMPLPGVSILIKGTNKGTVTGFDGDFVLKVSNSDILVFSYLGYKEQEVTVGNSSTINIILQEDLNSLEEVVVVGYGTVKKSDLTGSVASIKAADLVQSRSTSALEALQGRVAGVQVKLQSGEPGGAVNVSIRGVNSINGGSTPLYVIDGIQIDADESDVATSTINNSGSFNPLSTLDPNDIESIEFLKDASATAIYGSRGANGVIIVTTKSGKSGKFSFTFRSSLGVSNAANEMNMLRAEQYIEHRLSIEGDTSDYLNEDGSLLDVSGLTEYDWEEEGLRTAFTQSHGVSMSGGNETTTFSASAGYYDEEGLLINNGFERLNGRMKVGHKFSDRFKADFNLSSTYTKTTGFTGSGGYRGVMRSLLIANPIPVPNSDVLDDQLNNSPLDRIYGVDRNSTLSRNLMSLALTYNFTDKFSYKILGTSNTSESKGDEFHDQTTQIGRDFGSRGVLRQVSTSALSVTNQLNYSFNINKNNRFKLLAAGELTKNVRENFLLDVGGFPFETTGINDIFIASTVLEKGTNRDVRNRISYLGRLNYNYKGKYFFTGSIRRDGSDALTEKNRFANFPSAALAWTVSKENFLKNSNVISNLKFRGGYGVTGNERIESGVSFSRFANVIIALDNVETLGLIPARVSNPNLDWEITSQYNVGLDLGLFNDKINLTIDAYKKTTDDMLLDRPLSSQTGYFSRIENIGSLENIGMDLSLSTYNITTSKFSWKTDITVSHNKNEVTSLGIDGSIIPVTVGRAIIQDIGRIEAGQPIGSIYGFEFDGVYQLDDFVNGESGELKPDVVTGLQDVINPGSLKFKDQLTVDTDGDGIPDAGDGVINDDDKTYIGNSNPDFFGGINNTFKFGNFDFNFFLEWQYGNEIFNQSRYNTEGQNLWNVRQDFYNNRWTPDNPTNEYPTIIRNNSTSNYTSSYFVEDGSYIRLANATLGYNLPTKVLNKIGFQSARLYVTGTNLKVWTKYTGYDPDVSSSNRLLSGLDRSSYPRARTFTLGMNVSF
ncbi:TonB-dependent receptor [uncultured Algibacter sp.]|uniref:SusC/RagA family TonB-linked outer membrane protein n=1 Tax=uncultured Algibacter sp. TaxID=298659 RepID=UPI002614A55E|nr:TonB-dependent receptor [uncultured Algibacter sp.]